MSFWPWALAGIAGAWLLGRRQTQANAAAVAAQNQAFFGGLLGGPVATLPDPPPPMPWQAPGATTTPAATFDMFNAWEPATTPQSNPTRRRRRNPAPRRYEKY